MERLGRLLLGLSAAGTYVGGGALIVAAFYVATEVIGRRVFAVSFTGANEISAYVMAVGSAWAFGYALFRRAHIRIDAVYRLLPRRMRAFMDIVALVAIGGFALIIFWHAWDVLVYIVRFSVKSETPRATPLWIPMSLWVMGLGLFVVIALFLLVRSGLALVRGDFAESQRLIGTADDIELETEGLLETPGSGPAKAKR